MFDLSWLTRYFDWRREMLVKGRSYFNKGSVLDVGTLDEVNGTKVYAKVNGSKLYRTTISFDKNGNYKESSCSCLFHRSNDGEICKHIAALYLYLKNNALLEKRNITPGKDFLDELLEGIEAPVTRRNVNLAYQIHYLRGSYDTSWYLSFKIGLEKLYIVKNIKEFIECIIDGRRLEFGKSFTYNGKIHSFSEVDREVFDFLIQLYAAEMSYKAKYYTSGTSGLLNGKHVVLNDELFIKLCSIIKNKKVLLKDIYTDIEDVEIINDKLPFRIFINGDDNSVKASIKFEGEYKILGTKDRIMLCGNKLYILDNSKKAYEFLNIFRRKNITSIEFIGEEKAKLLSLLPQIISEDSIAISENITRNYIRTDIKSNLYIDRFRRGIALRLEFLYDEHIINPFKNADVNPYIIRDYPIENRIIRLIEEAEFKIKDDRIYLEDYDKIYVFFRDMVPIITELCSIYYTNDVKNIYVGRLKGYKSYASGGLNDNLININLELEGIDDREVGEILASIKEKRKYHRLKNGSILSLEGKESEDMSKLIDEIELNEIKDNVIKLSKYRALGFFEKIRGNEDFAIDNSEEIYELINKIKNPKFQNAPEPKGLEAVLRDYQLTGYRWLYTLSESGFAGILADDMGLGKTLQAIALMNNNKDGRVSIVVSPSSLVYNWENEIKKFAPNMKALVIEGNRTLRKDMIGEISDYDVVITSYPLIRRDIELYEYIKFKYCILDEAQHIKNPESVNANSVKRLNAESRFALTGTPIENSLTELWSIFDFLMPGYLLSRNGFSEKFERPIVRGDDSDAIKQLRKLIAPFILRRKKKDVLSELPDKIETKLICELTEEQKKLYIAYIARAKEEIAKKIEADGFDKSRIEILSMITRLRQICCHPSMFIEGYSGGSGKLELLEELIDELIAGEHKILLFSQFTSLLDIIKERFEEKNIKYLYLDGSVPTFKRMSLVENFNEGDSKVFLISLKAGGTGLNLTSADCVIHFDPWWNPAVEDQASDRAHRIGQKNIVEVFKLITKDTIEEKIYELQNKKKELIESVITEGETFINKLSEEEIMSLFKIEN